MVKISDQTITKIRMLRLRGLSLREIQSRTQLSRATISKYCHGLRSNNRAKHNPSGSIAAKAKWDIAKSVVRERAKAEWPKIRRDPNMMGFLGLYWGEGRKHNSNCIGISNNDPDVIRIAYETFLKLSDKQLVATIYCYPSHDYTECETFWTSLLPRAEIRLRDVRDKRMRDPHRMRQSCRYGKCDLRFSDWRCYHRIMTWIECWREN